MGLIWNTNPSYGNLIVSWLTTIATVKVTCLVASYIESKLPAHKTVMDLVSMFFLKLVLLGCVSSSVFNSILTFYSDSGETIAVSASWLMFYLAQTSRLEALAIVILQLLCTNYPWLLESSTFEKIFKGAIFIAIPTLALMSAFLMSYLGYTPPVWYELLRGQDSVTLDGIPLLIRIISISIVTVFYIISRLSFRIIHHCEHNPNYIIRLDIIACCAFQNVLTNLLAPSYLPTMFNLISLQFTLLISLSHSGIRDYALNRPLIRPLANFYRTRLSRRVDSLHTVRV